MALARIITRSHACSRELALDLLARGYAVEIVSPDAIPDNIADLELRVEEEPGNQLVATVEARHGERSASLDFVHHLRAPIADFVRRPMESRELCDLAKQPVRSVDPIIKHKISPADALQVTPQLIAVPEAAVDVPENVAVISAPETSSQVEVPGSFPIEVPNFAVNIPETPIAKIVTERSRPAPATTWRDRSLGWRLLIHTSVMYGLTPRRTALACSSVIVLAVLVAFGMWRSGQPPRQSTAPGSSEKAVAVSADAPLASAVELGRAQAAQVAAPTLSPSMPSQPSSPRTLTRTPAAESAPIVENPRATISPRPEGGIVARDTVTYLDKRFEPRTFSETAKKIKAEKHLVHSRPKVRRHGDAVIVANKVTYLDKPAPKATK